MHPHTQYEHHIKQCNKGRRMCTRSRSNQSRYRKNTLSTVGRGVEGNTLAGTTSGRLETMTCPSGFSSSNCPNATNYPYDIYSAKLVAAPAYYRRDIVSPNTNIRVFVAGKYDQYTTKDGEYVNTNTQFDLHPISSVYSTFGWGQFPNGYGHGIHPGKFNSPSELCDPEPLRYSTNISSYNRNRCNYAKKPTITNLNV